MNIINAMVATVIAALLVGAVVAPAQAARPDAATLEAANRQVKPVGVHYPADSGVVNVKAYGAKGDGKTDDTAAIQQALSDYANASQIIYLPEGTYLISDTLRWGDGAHGGMAQKRTILQGQSRDKTIIRLKDGAAGYGDAKKGKAMIWTGKKPAQRFRNGIRDLTVHTGTGNAGAIGVQYIANNQGSMRDVLIVGDGPIGLDLGYTDEQGPCLIQRIRVEGFDVGISTRTVVDSIVMEFIELEGQKVVGFRNEGQCVSIRGLTSRNTVTAVENLGANSLLTLIDSKLEGGTAGRAVRGGGSTRLVAPGDARLGGGAGASATAGAGVAGPAVVNTGAAMLRNVTVTGYALGVKNTIDTGTKQDAPAGQIELFVSHEIKTLFDMPEPRKRTLDLPIKETPALSDVPMSKWAGPHQFGGEANGKDATAAVQKAIDSGAAVIYFPYGDWRIDGVVDVKPSVLRITALEGSLKGDGTLRIAAGDAASQPLHIDRLNLLYQNLNVSHESKRPLIISGATWGKGHLKTASGAGDLFLDDLCIGELRLTGQNVWARQLNCEANDVTKIINDGGKLWILGYKTEQSGTLIETRNSGSTEVVGGFAYAQGKVKTTPMFIVDNASMSATIGESTWNGRNFKVVVQQVRGGETRELPRVFWRANNATMLPLFVGHAK